MDAYTPLEELPESTRELFEYNPEKAKQLLDEAGYPGPNRFTTSCLCSTEDHVNLLSMVKNYWDAIGVTLNIDVRDKTVYTSMQNAKTFKGMTFGGSQITSGPYKIPEITCGMAKSYGYCDQYIEDLFTKIWAFENIGKDDVQQQCKKEISLYVLPQAIMIQLPAPYTYRLWWPWAKNYHGESSISYSGGTEFARFVWIDQDLKKEITGRR
jgi:peptide/nickel transport system substrate-binding protein